MIVYHCLTCNAPLPSNRINICPACRQIEAIENASKAATQQAEYQYNRSRNYSNDDDGRVVTLAQVDASFNNLMGSIKQQDDAESTTLLVFLAIYLIIDYNLNWFFAKFAVVCGKLLYIMFFGWWI